MEISRLIFTKETKDKMEQGLNKLQRGKLRWEKLKEAEDNGKLLMAKNRYEVANMAGFTTTEKKKGYNWVSNMIRRGQLQEHIYSIGGNGKMEYEYKLGERPDYERKNAQEARWGTQPKSTEIIDTPKPTTTKKKKQVSLKERGRQMFARLKAFAEEGGLEKEMTRAELAKYTGTTRSWVCGLIERGFLNEELVDYSGGLPRYKYSLTEKEPNYDNSKFNSSAIKRRTETTVSTVAKDTATTVDNTQAIKVDLTRGEVSIKIEFNNYKQVEEVIKLILKGE